MPYNAAMENNDGNRIYRIELGSPSAWLYGAPGHWMLVDAGTRRTVPTLLLRLQEIGCAPSDIALIVVTHGHYDHVGAIHALLEKARIPVLAHRRDAAALSGGAFVMSDGFTASAKAGAYCMRHLASKISALLEPFPVDVPVDCETRLEPYGFSATVVPTPGHSAGSVSVLTDDGVLFAGDLMVNRPYPGVWRYMSMFGDSREEIKKQWRTLLDRGAKTVCPGHGAMFPAENLRPFL